MFKEKLAKLGWDIASAIFWALLIILTVVFSNVSTTQFIYNQF